LSWSHVVEILPLKESLHREFYTRMCMAERWSVRTLRERIDSMLYERTALSRKPEAQIIQELAALRDTQRMTPALLMRDPYVLDLHGRATRRAARGSLSRCWTSTSKRRAARRP
jgi:predicted nuclease of restriction endonuclease-like (RecB) superfamily